MQTTLDQFYKSRKRPAIDELKGYHSKLTARKLFSGDDFDRKDIEPLEKPSIKDAKEIQSKYNGCRSSKLIKNNDVPTTTANKVKIRVSCQPDDVTVLSAATESNNLVNNTTEDEDGRRTPVSSPASQEKIMKELGLGEFKHLVRNSKRISALKQSLQRFKSSESRLKEIEKKIKKLDSQELQHFDSVQIEVPSSPRKCGTPLKPQRLTFVSPSPQKEYTYVSPRKLLDEGPSRSPIKPSIERYNYLLASGKDPLVLPHKYLMLKEVFRSVDTIVKILVERGETVTFSKLKPDVQKMLKRNFVESHLGQIKKIDPSLYEFSQEKVKMPFSKTAAYQLVIRPTTTAGKVCGIKINNGASFLLLERQRSFHNKLLEHTKNLHREFLRSLDPPIEVENDQIKRWHPEFDLDNVPDIVSENLPHPPDQDKVTSVKSFLEKAHNLLQCNKRMEQAINSINPHDQICNDLSPRVDKHVSSLTAISQECSSHSPIADLQKALKGIPKSLLEKIRAKQAAKIAESMTQSAESVREDVMMSRMPELARIMRNVFVTEKKCILPQDVVVLKVSHSYRENLTNGELIQHLQLISKHVPGWMNFYNVRNTAYVRLSKDADMSRIIGKLEKLAGYPV